MAMLPNRIEEFNLLIDEQNRRSKQMLTGIRYGRERLKRLHEGKFEVEALLVNGQLVEQAVKSTIRSFLVKRSGFDAAGLPDPYPKISKSDLERRPLGDVVARLREYVGETRLVELLDDFNEKRADFIHHAFDGTREPEALDKEAASILSNSSYEELVLGLVKLETQVKKETESLY